MTNEDNDEGFVEDEEIPQGDLELLQEQFDEIDSMTNPVLRLEAAKKLMEALRG